MPSQRLDLVNLPTIHQSRKFQLQPGGFRCGSADAPAVMKKYRPSSQAIPVKRVLMRGAITDETNEIPKVLFRERV
jgi:hypothetical protein